MKIKTIYKSLLALPLLAVSMTSCSDWLEIKPQNVVTINEFWNEKADVDNMITGLYSHLQSQNVMERMMVWGEFRSDDVAEGSSINDNQALQNIFLENINAQNGYTTWDQFYYIINQANTIIDKAPSVADKDPAFSQSELRADLAEAAAIRDLCYFYLIRTFRDVPYTTQAYYDDDQTMNLPASSFNSILDSLITDLEGVKDYAVTRYPASDATKALYQTGRITKDAIYALLCDMYLWKQDYQNCIKYADLVIADKRQQYQENLNESGLGSANLSRFNGFPLINDYYTGSGYFGNAYSTIFGTGGGDSETGNSSESIFELTFMSADNMPSCGAINSLYGPAKNGTGYASPSSYVKDVTTDRSSTNYLYYNKDARYYENIQNGGSTIGKYLYQDCMINRNSSPYSVIRTGAYTENKVKSNWIIYRLTDVMLMKAEALAAMIGNEADLTDQDKSYLKDAFTIVNAVDKRSICQSDAELKDTLVASSYTTKEQIQNLVLDERQRELMFEGKRYFDLVRRARRDGNTDVLRTNVLHKFSTGTATISNKFSKMDYIYWPYNNDELKVNKNLSQNPAFGSGESETVKRN